MKPINAILTLSTIFLVGYFITRDHLNKLVLKNAKLFLNLKEIKGDQDSNIIINKMFNVFGYNYTDETAWCSLFLNYILYISGAYYNGQLNARSFLEYPGPNKSMNELKEGDIVILWRGSPNLLTGHVGFYVDQDENYLYLLSGNYQDSVNISPFNKNRYLTGKEPIKA